MNKTSKELDLSSVITQVSKDAAATDQHRSGPPTAPAVASGTGATTNTTKGALRAKRRRMNRSFRLCFSLFGSKTSHSQSSPVLLGWSLPTSTERCKLRSIIRNGCRSRGQFLSRPLQTFGDERERERLDDRESTFRVLLANCLASRDKCSFRGSYLWLIGITHL
jgi:hypothetical protein